MSDLSYSDQKKKVMKGLILLAVITIFEVFFALLTTGHIVESINFRGTPLHYLYIVVMIGLSLYKAYFIIYEFMHMGYEVPGLRVSVLLPTALLIWAVVAFFQEGSVWGERRALINERNDVTSEKSVKVISGDIDKTTKSIEAIPHGDEHHEADH